MKSWHPFAHPSHATFDHSDTCLAVKNTSGQIACIDIVAGRVTATYSPDDHDEGASLLFSADDRFIVDASWSGFVTVRRRADLVVTKTFLFPGEMIKEVSSTRDRATWLFLHQPRAGEGENFAPAPYLTLWRWPFSGPAATFASGFDNVYAATLSPAGDGIAVVGYRRSDAAQRIAILSRDGELQREAPTTMGGTGARTRWSYDGSLVGTVQKKAFTILDAASLAPRAVVPEEYPADISILRDGRIVLGTWERGWIVKSLSDLMAKGGTP